jgi:two-component system, NtrC family, sensor kinase
MRKISFKASLVFNFMLVILFLSVSIGILGFKVIREEILDKAQHQVANYIGSARVLYENMAASMGKELSFLTKLDDLEGIRKKAGLDYLYLVEKEDFGKLKSEIALRAVSGEEISGTRIILADELDEMGKGFSEKARIDIFYTPKAKDTAEGVLEDAMAIEYARPVLGETQEVERILYGGKIMNGTNDIVDTIRDLIFGEEEYRGKPVGTVTIFQQGVRISTNVIKGDGQRAVGTRVSGEVYDHVLIGGARWTDRAFVVTDWYITSYEPIRNIDGERIGMLYVGILEQPFFDMSRKVSVMFFTIVATAVALAIVISVFLAGSIVRPVKRLVEGTSKIAGGELGYRVNVETPIGDIGWLNVSFNEMAESLEARNRDLVLAKERREALNKRYIDLISFVSHELKGILSSTILNAYSVRDGFLGMVNFKQQKALDSITRNLDHLEATVKNFLNLSRIEKGDMGVNKKTLLVKEEVFDIAVDTFQKQMLEKEIEVKNNIPPELSAEADRDLIQVVANNLISNAVKYGSRGGKIEINAQDAGDKIRISVYNDGRVLREEERNALFQRFSRLDAPETKNAKGTGLGLFISREIVEKHGGTMSVEPGKAGNTFIFEICKGG